MKLQKVTDPAFKKYGKVVENVDFSELVEERKKTPWPQEVVYEPSVEQLEALPVYQALQDVAYGEMPIQIGYCNGSNVYLNALEYHRSSEIDVAANDLILLLGQQQDIEEGDTYDTAKVEAFLLPAGVGVELYATSLHYAPCNASDEGFRCAIVLPDGTNQTLDENHYAGGEDRLLTAKNKWLIGHPEGGLPEGSHLGLKGENLCVKDLER